MKNLVTLTAITLAMLACGRPQSASNVAASQPAQQETTGHEIHAPRAITPAIAVGDEKALENYLTALIEEYEGLKANDRSVPEDKQLDVDFDPHEKPCTLSTDGAKLSCEVMYLQDRWNGTMDVELKVESGKAVTLTKIDFDGSL